MSGTAFLVGPPRPSVFYFSRKVVYVTPVVHDLCHVSLPRYSWTILLPYKFEFHIFFFFSVGVSLHP